MLGSGLNLVTTVIGFGMSATFIVFVCARLICGRARPVDSRDVAYDLDLHSDLEAVSNLSSFSFPFFPCLFRICFLDGVQFDF